MNMKKLNTLVICALVGLLNCAASLVPSAAAQDEIVDQASGGGWITGTPSGAKANFGIYAGVSTNSVATNSVLFGELNYKDHDTGMHVVAVAVTAYTIVDDETRQIEFDVEIDGEPGTATVIVSDLGEPGRNDTFEIVLSDGYTASGVLGGGKPGGGNLQVTPPLDE
jgi:hypothetical protein